MIRCWNFLIASLLLSIAAFDSHAQHNRLDCVYGVDLDLGVSETFSTRVQLFQKDDNTAFILCQTPTKTAIYQVSSSTGKTVIGKPVTIKAPYFCRLFLCNDLSNLAIGGPPASFDFNDHDQIEVLNDSIQTSKKLSAIAQWKHFEVIGKGCIDNACVAIVVDDRDIKNTAAIISLQKGNLYTTGLPTFTSLPKSLQISAGKLFAVESTEVDGKSKVKISSFHLSIEKKSLQIKRDTHFEFALAGTSILEIKDVKVSPDQSKIAVMTIENSNEMAYLRVFSLADNIPKEIVKEKIGKPSYFERLPLSWGQNETVYFIWKGESHARIFLESLNVKTNERKRLFATMAEGIYSYQDLNLGFINNHGPIATWTKMSVPIK